MHSLQVKFKGLIVFKAIEINEFLWLPGNFAFPDRELCRFLHISLHLPQPEYPKASSVALSDPKFSSFSACNYFLYLFKIYPSESCSSSETLVPLPRNARLCGLTFHFPKRDPPSPKHLLCHGSPYSLDSDLTLPCLPNWWVRLIPLCLWRAHLSVLLPCLK